MAIYTCCQAIKRLSDIGVSGEGAQHYHMSDEGMWKHDRLLLDQGNMGLMLPYHPCSFSFCFVHMHPAPTGDNNRVENQKSALWATVQKGSAVRPFCQKIAQTKCFPPQNSSECWYLCLLALWLSDTFKLMCGLYSCRSLESQKTLWVDDTH